mmetsp:Transcript_27455/g.50639  ORF Transcript_27455/g.50639 Transcript_27455/m.50639 type:complete len:380 (+) Transcript_27455:3379-4518(+)
MTKNIFIPKETRHDERRVVLRPEDLSSFVQSGFSVHVEEGAGDGLDIADASYVGVGAELSTREEIWTSGGFIPKLLCPTEAEIEMLAPNTHLSAFLYAGEHYKLVQAMSQKQTSAYSYEYFQDDTGAFPMMRPDGWLSGRLAVLNAVFYLQSQFGGRGQTLGAPDGTPSGNVVVIGHGNVGDAAAQTALSLGGNVTVVGRTPERLQHYAQNNPEISCLSMDDGAFADAVKDADIIVGAILISTYDTPALLTEQHVKSMRKGSVIVDVTCGYGAGGYLPTADKITMPGVAPYVRHGVLHIKNPRLPAMAPHSASAAASKHYAPYLLNLASAIFDADIEDAVSKNGQIMDAGTIVHSHVLSDFAKIESEEFENYELADHLA